MKCITVPGVSDRRGRGPDRALQFRSPTEAGTEDCILFICMARPAELIISTMITVWLCLKINMEMGHLSHKALCLDCAGGRERESHVVL